VLDRGPERRWEDRLRHDRQRALDLRPPSLRTITAEVLRRAEHAGTSTIALTGSTARERRTAISDIDFHVVGPRPDLSGLPGEVDLVADSLSRFQRRLVEGDDFVQWTVRLGCVLGDPDRIFGDAFARIERCGLWPDPRRKFERADALASLAEQVLMIEDRDAAQEHLRAGLTSYSRGVLLANGVFPLARNELAMQLGESGHEKVGEWLYRSIHVTLRVDELRVALRCLRQELARSSTHANTFEAAA
jgi:predicted nucleotidyltransferase